jgi:hypothetical protein
LFGWNVRLPLATTEISCVSSPRITGGARVRRAHAEETRTCPGHGRPGSGPGQRSRDHPRPPTSGPVADPPG